MLRVNKLPDDFVEGMACVGGCVGGPQQAQGGERVQEGPRRPDRTGGWAEGERESEELSDG